MEQDVVLEVTLKLMNKIHKVYKGVFVWDRGVCTNPLYNYEQMKKGYYCGHPENLFYFIGKGVCLCCSETSEISPTLIFCSQLYVCAPTEASPLSPPCD